MPQIDENKHGHNSLESFNDMSLEYYTATVLSV